MFLGSIVMYRCMTHNILVSQSCGGGCRKLVSCGRLWVYRFHNQCSLSAVIVVMYYPFWSYMLEIEAWICMVGLFGKMSLSGLHSCVNILRLVIFKGGV